MASNSFPPLLLLPLHIVGNILEHSDSIQQLGTTILSHRIFYNAFKEHPRYIAQSIIATQIPETTLPYALLSLESSRMAPGDRAAINGMLARFCPKSHDTGESGNSFTCFHHLSETLATPSLSLNTLSWSDYASLSRDYEVVLLLRQIMAEESVTMLNIFGIKHTASLTTAEKFRLNRSFYLFQTVCNMFCTSVWPEDWRLNFDNYMLRFDHTPEEYLGVLFHYFSPWVNHRLLCVYRFLERNIVRSFNYLAENDIGYAGWSARYVYTDSSFIRCHELFTRGLSFHLTVYQTKGYEATSQLLKPPQGLEPRYALDGVSGLFECLNDTLEVLVEKYQLWDIKVGDLTSEHWDLLSRPQDGEFDGLQSSSCHNWKCAWYDTNFNECQMARYVSWLVECAYVIWDYSGIPDRLLSEKLKAMSDCKPPYGPRRGLSATEDDIRSMDQRLDIYLRGGEGWWPTKGVDFSRVTGLTEQEKEELLCEWRFCGWVESSKRKRSGSSSSCSSVKSTVSVRRRYS